MWKVCKKESIKWIQEEGKQERKYKRNTKGRKAREKKTLT